MKILTILGTRPEAIKLAPVIKELARRGGIVCRVCVTAQHRQMLDQVLALFELPVDYDLDVMTPNQTLATLTAKTITLLDGILAKEQPQLVIVQGDTTTVLSGTLAAFYRRVPVAHVEAGLRTGTLEAPWPEEANRVLVSRLAAVHFAPTKISRDNLINEGVNADRVFVTGNTVIDALNIALQLLQHRRVAVPGLPEASVAGLGNGPVVLVTGHRRENFGSGMESICTAIRNLAVARPHTHFVYPVHLNPHVREPVMRLLGRGFTGSPLPNVHLIEPLDYLPFVALMKRATCILTDSGGVQEEAPSLGKPVLVMRDTTERPEAVAAGTVRLVGTCALRIEEGIAELLDDPVVYARMSSAHNPYGDGMAAARIVDACISFLRERGHQNLL